MSIIDDIYFNGELDSDGNIELTVICKSSKFSQCEEITIPGSINLNGTSRRVVLIHKSLECLKKVKIIHLSNGAIIKSGNPFYFCTELESIMVDDDNVDYCSIDGVLFNKQKTKLIYFPLKPKSLKKFTFPTTVVECEFIVSRYIELNFGIETIIKKRAISSILTSLLNKTKNNEVRQSRKVESIPFDLWNRELEKCKTIEDYDRYLRTYNHSSNIFIQRAKHRRELLVSKLNNDPKDSSDIFEKLKSVVPLIYGIGILVAPIVIGLGLRSWYYSYKESQNRHHIVYPTDNMLVNSYPNIDKPTTDDDIHINDNNQAHPRTQDEISSPFDYAGYPSDNHHIENEIDEEKTQWESYYQETYSRMEQRAESEHRSLCNIGISYQNNGRQEGYTGRTDPYIATQIAQFRKLQNEMRALRNEASQKGIYIQQSRWESAQINL